VPSQPPAAPISKPTLTWFRKNGEGANRELGRSKRAIWVTIDNRDLTQDGGRGKVSLSIGSRVERGNFGRSDDARSFFCARWYSGATSTILQKKTQKDRVRRVGDGEPGKWETRTGTWRTGVWIDETVTRTVLFMARGMDMSGQSGWRQVTDNSDEMEDGE
jgi:hypothetical protein